MKLSPSPSCSASTHQRCQRNPWRRRVPKSETRSGPSAASDAQAFDLAPELGLGARIEHVESEPAHPSHRRPRAQFVDDGERGNFPHRGLSPGTLEPQFVLPVAARQLVFRQPEPREPFHELGLENLLGAIETVAGEPDQLVLRHAQRARVIELIGQLPLVDDLGEPNARGPIDQLECDPAAAVQLPDHLQHEKLIEVRIEQGAHDRIDAEGMVVNACGEIGYHASSLGGAARADKGAAQRLDRVAATHYPAREISPDNPVDPLDLLGVCSETRHKAVTQST